MSTSNILANTSEWTKVVDASDSDFLITWGDSRTLEVSTTETDIAPVIKGHRFHRETQVTREVVGAGYVWVKAVTSGISSSFNVVVTKTGSVAGAVGGYDSFEQVQKVAVLNWNPIALAWERATADGSSSGTSGTPMSKRIESIGSFIYVGEAAIGSLDSNPVWLIKRVQLDVTGFPTEIKWANGSWDSRASLSYQ